MMELKRRFLLMLFFLGVGLAIIEHALQPALASPCDEPLGHAHPESLTPSGWRTTEDLAQIIHDATRPDDTVVPVFFYSYVSDPEHEKPNAPETPETQATTTRRIQRESFERMSAAVRALAAQYHFAVLNTIPGGRIVVAEMTVGVLRVLVSTPRNEPPNAANTNTNAAAAPIIEPAWRIALNTAIVTIARP